MFKKPTKKFKSRATEDDSEDDTEAARKTSAPVKKNKKPKKPKPSSQNLSFATDEDEGDESAPTFKIKKSKNSRLAAKGVQLGTSDSGVGASAAMEDDDQAQTASCYDSSALAALKASQTALPSSFIVEEEDAVEVGGAAGDEVGELKEDAGDSETLGQLNEAERLAVAQARQHRTAVSKGLVSAALPSSRTSAATMGDADNLGAAAALRHQFDKPTTSLGDEASRAASENFLPLKRRAEGAGSDYRKGGGDGGGGGGFGGGQEGGGNSLRSQLYSELEGGADDDDDMAAWEEEALRRGNTNIVKPPPAAPPPPALKVYAGGFGDGGNSTAQAGGPKVTVSEVLRSVRSVVAQAGEAQERNERDFEALRRELELIPSPTSKTTATTTAANKPTASNTTTSTASKGAGPAVAKSLEEEKAALSEQFEFFQRLKFDVATLCGCVREKRGLAVEVLDAVHEVCAAAGLARRRRRQERQDDALREALQKGTLTSLGRRSRNANAAASGGGGNGGAREDEEEYELSQDPRRTPGGGGGDGVDDFGRDRGHSLKAELQRKKEERARRRVWAWRRAQGLDGDGNDEDEDDDEDDELMGEKEAKGGDSGGSDKGGGQDDDADGWGGMAGYAAGGGGLGSGLGSGGGGGGGLGGGGLGFVASGLGSGGDGGGGGLGFVASGLGSGGGGGGGGGLGFVSSTHKEADNGVRIERRQERRLARARERQAEERRKAFTVREPCEVLSEEDDDDDEAAVAALVKTAHKAAAAADGEVEEVKRGGFAMEVRRRELVDCARLIFEDVSAKFASLGPVKTDLFAAWRTKFPAEYAAAYVSESLPQVLEAFALVELAEWELLWVGAGPGATLGGAKVSLVDAVRRADQDNNEEEGEESEEGGNAQQETAEKKAEDSKFYHADNCVFPLTDLTWIGELADFAEEEEEEEEEEVSDMLEKKGAKAKASVPAAVPATDGHIGGDGGNGAAAVSEGGNKDATLVPRMVALAVVPRVASKLRGPAYDPFSSSATRCLVGCVGELLEFELTAKDLPALLAAPLVSLEHAVRHLCVPLATGPSFNNPNDDDEDNLDEGGGGGGMSGLELTVAQLCAGLKLLRNASAWAALCDPCALAALAVRDLLVCKLAPAFMHLLRLGPKGGEHAHRLVLTHLPQALPPDPGAVGWGPTLRAAAPALTPLVEALERSVAASSDGGGSGCGGDVGLVAVLRSRLSLL